MSLALPYALRVVRCGVSAGREQWRGRGAGNNAVCFSYLPVAGLGEMLSLLHREGEAYTLMETELQSLELCGLPEDISPLSTS